MIEGGLVVSGLRPERYVKDSNMLDLSQLGGAGGDQSHFNY